MNKFTAISHSALLGVVLASGAIPAPAMAQQSGASNSDAIIVTARRREENIQDVPLSVSAVSGAQIEQANLSDTTQLAQFAPNVVLNTVEVGTPGGGAFSIRGVSYQDVEKTFDPTVLVMVDGIVRGSGTGQTMGLLDVERVEILRGPQGTLFGKNAVGGIINITRRSPKLDSTFGSVRGTLGNFETNNLEGYVNIGGSQAALKLTASRLDHEGYFKNITRGDREGGRTEQNYGAAVLVEPTDTLSFKASYDYKDIDGSAFPVLNISDRSAAGPSGDFLCTGLPGPFGFPGQCSPGPGQAQSGDPFVNMGSRKSELSYTEDFGAFEANWDFTKDMRLTYLFGYLEGDDYIAFDSDGSPANFFAIHRNGKYKQKSHELRVTRNGDILNWQAGVYFWDAQSSDTQVYEQSIIIPIEFADTFSGKSESTSVFGEGDVRLATGLVATAGFRWIEETKSIVKPGLGGSGKRTDDDVMWRAGLRYEPTDDIMTYLTYSTGFRSGGFSARAGTLEVLEAGNAPETLENFEGGVKTSWLDNRLRVNASIFHMNYKDMQIESNIPCPTCASGQQTAVLNVGKAKIDGIEVDFSAHLTDQWTLAGNVGLLDAKYKDFFTDLLGTGTPADYSYLPLRRAPEVTYAIQSVYDVPVPTGNVSFRVGYNWTSDYAGTIDDHPGTHIDSFGLLDASVTYDHGKDWTFVLFGNNLTDEGAFSHTYAVAPTAQGGSLWKFANPRVPLTYGVKLTYRFGEQ